MYPLARDTEPIDFSAMRSPPQYAVYQLERTDFLHLQVYCYWESRKLGSTVSSLFIKAGFAPPHLEIRRGTHSEVTSLSNSQAFLTSRKRQRHTVKKQTPELMVHGSLEMIQTYLKVREHVVISYL